MTQLTKDKRLRVRLFAVNLGLVFLPLLVGTLLSDSSQVRLVSALSALLLPFSTGFLVVVLSKKQALWILGGLSVISVLGFVIWGIWFLFLVPVWIGLIFPAMERRWWSWILAVLVVFFGIATLLPGLGRPGSSGYAASDLSNVKQICTAIATYREVHFKLPDRLSQLQDVTNSPTMFVSPRRRRDWVTRGPLRIWLDRTDPGPPRKITSWTEVDGGDYLYRKPPERVTDGTIMVMTRPGLLDHNWISVGFADGHVERLATDFQKRRADVLEFLRQTGAAPP